MALSTPEIDKILYDFTTSYWLKDALETALTRDMVDAAHDAEVLAQLLRQRLERRQGRPDRGLFRAAGVEP